MPAYPWLAQDTWGIARINGTSLAGTKHWQCEITYGSQGSSPSAAADATTWFNLWEVEILPRQISSYVLQYVDVVLNKSGNLQEARSTNAAVGGGMASEGLPPNCGVTLRKHTGILGRHGRGHIFVPGVAASEVQTDDTTLLTPSALAAWTTIGSNLYAACLTAQLPMALISRHPWNLPPLDYHWIGVSGVTANRVIGLQNRRVRKAAHR